VDCWSVEAIKMLGLILEGGGMRAGFVSGAVMALMDMGLTDFDVAVAVSASVPTLAYCAAGQREEMERVWRDELCTSKLVCYRNIPAASLTLSTKRPILDIDYLVYEVFKKKYPLDVENLIRGGTVCRFAVTRAPEGSLAFLSPPEHDIYETFKAALAVPGAYPGTVCVDDCEYVDGGTVNPLPARSLFDEGVEKVLAVLSKPLDCENEPPSFLERTILWRYLHRYEWMVEKLWESAQAYNEQVSFLERLARKSPASSFMICPDKMPPARFITRDRRKINRTIDMGYRKVEELEDEIRIFMH
jgi:predicted patatin/cPLA2 family phospholipase